MIVDILLCTTLYAQILMYLIIYLCFIWALFIFINSLKTRRSYEKLCVKYIILTSMHFFWFYCVNFFINP